VPPAFLIQIQDGGKRVEHGSRRIAIATLLESGVVVGAHARKQSEFLSAQTRRAASSVLRKVEVSGINELAPRTQEIAQRLVALVERTGMRTHQLRVPRQRRKRVAYEGDLQPARTRLG
jgi:hypothetical protein